MWLLTWMPDFVFHLLLLAGLLGLAASFVLGFMPFVSTYKLPIQAASVLAIIISVWFEGGIANEAKWQARITELEAKIAKAEVESAEANGKLSKRLAAKDKEIALAQAEIKSRIKDRAAAMDAVCKIPADVVSIINDAAKKVTKK